MINKLTVTFDCIWVCFACEVEGNLSFKPSRYCGVPHAGTSLKLAMAGKTDSRTVPPTSQLLWIRVRGGGRCVVADPHPFITAPTEQLVTQLSILYLRRYQIGLLSILFVTKTSLHRCLPWGPVMAGVVMLPQIQIVLPSLYPL